MVLAQHVNASNTKHVRCDSLVPRLCHFCISISLTSPSRLTSQASHFFGFNMPQSSDSEAVNLVTASLFTPGPLTQLHQHPSRPHQPKPAPLDETKIDYSDTSLATRGLNEAEIQNHGCGNTASTSRRTRNGGGSADCALKGTGRSPAM